jgi:glutaredoxin
MRYRTLIAALGLAVSATQAGAQIYKWTDPQGHVHFGDRPAGTVQAEVVTPKINSYSGAEVMTEESLPATPDQPKHHDVMMYSASWCGVCKQARAYFVAKHIPFTEYDVEQSDKGKHDFAALHGHGVPIILVGNRRMNGFDAGAFDAMYRSG